MVATPKQAGLAYEPVKISTTDGETLHGWFVPAAAANGTVLFFHGNAGNISHRMEYLLMFHRLGYDTFIFDYRGYGESSGAPSESGTYLDAQAAWRYLTETKGIPPARIMLFGESLGGAACGARKAGGVGAGVGIYLGTRHGGENLSLPAGAVAVPLRLQHAGIFAVGRLPGVRRPQPPR